MSISSKACYLLILSVAMPVCAKASWLSKISGVSIDLNRGSISVQPPDLSAIPPMIQNLPKDLGQALLNPAAPALATAIRFSKGQALNRGVQPLPPDVRQRLSPYFPPQVLDSVRWTTADGLSIDGALKNWFNQEGGITYDDVIVFADARSISNDELVAHELTHVLQYAQMGVETFAFQYTIDFESMESQARENASRVASSIAATSQGQPQTWGIVGSMASPSQQPTWAAMNAAAKQAIPPTQCIWIDGNANMTGNNCPTVIRVSGVIIRRISDGYTFTYPCNEPTCTFAPGASGPLLSPPGHQIIGVTAAYAIN